MVGGRRESVDRGSQARKPVSRSKLPLPSRRNPFRNKPWSGPTLSIPITCPSAQPMSNRMQSEVFPFVLPSVVASKIEFQQFSSRRTSEHAVLSAHFRGPFTTNPHHNPVHLRKKKVLKQPPSSRSLSCLPNWPGQPAFQQLVLTPRRLRGIGPRVIPVAVHRRMFVWRIRLGLSLLLKMMMLRVWLDVWRRR
jgi:hypothetical protein